MMNNNIGKLFFWCQKVLPLVYDNSLSYYEVLCKFQKKVNELVDNVNAIPEYIDDKVKEAFDEEHLRELISEVFRTIEDAITANNEGTNTNFSTDYPTIGTLVWHDNKLYRTKRKIDAGDTIIPNSNLELVNFGDMFNEFLTEIKTRFTDNDDGERETSSSDRPTHDLVWLHDELYEVIKPIAEGNAYIYSGANKNVETVNLDKIYDYILDLISSEINAREQADDTLQDNIDAEATARENADSTLQDNIDAEATTRSEADRALQDNIDAEALARENTDTTIDNKIGNLSNLNTTNKTNIVNAINEVKSFVKNFGNRIVIVGKSGCDYSTITSAVNAIASSVTENNPYLILILEGVYNEHVDLTDISGVTLYGIGNVIISDTSTYPMATIYVTNKVSLYNLRIIQFGDSYCIHSDTQGTNNAVKLTAINCVFQRTQMSNGTYQHCIGWGACDIGGDTYDIFNCNFIGGTGVGGHLNPFTTATGIIAWRIANCTFSVERATIDWGDACKVIYGVASAQSIACVLSGNNSNKGVIIQVGAGESYNYFKAGTFCTLYHSGGNNVPAMNNIGPSTQWIIGSFAQSNNTGLIFIPLAKANTYTLNITYAVLHGNSTDISGSCGIYSQSPNGFTVQTNNYTAVGDYAVMIGVLATPTVDTVL